MTGGSREVPGRKGLWRESCISYNNNNNNNNTVHALCMLDNWVYKHTLRMCNTYYFSTATVVTRTRLNVTLYVHCLSYWPMWPWVTRLSRALSRCFSRRFWNEFLSSSICAPYWCIQNAVIGRCGRAVNTPVLCPVGQRLWCQPLNCPTECGAVWSPSFATGKHRGSTTNWVVFAPLLVWTSWSQ